MSLFVMNKAIYLPGTGKHGLGQVNIPLQSCSVVMVVTSIVDIPTAPLVLYHSMQGYCMAVLA